MPELTDAQKVVRNDTAKRMADALEALAGTGGRGLPPGGTDGDVLVKNGATDYAANWTNTPKLLGNLATIEPTSSASKAYAAGDYLVYNGQLYKVTASTITQGQTLTPGGNIQAVSVGNMMTPVVEQLTPSGVYSAIVKEQYSAAVFKVGALCFVRIAFDAKSIPAVIGWKEFFTLPYTVSQDLGGAVSSNIVTREGKTTQIGVYQNIVRLNNPNSAIAEGDTISVVLPYITTDY